MNRVEADELARSPAERASLESLRELTGGSGTEVAMERHSVRVFLIAEQLAKPLGADLDRELLFCASILHDAGIYPQASTGDAYVRDSGRLIERVLEPFAWPPERLERCVEAAEYHHDLRTQWERGTEVELVRRADLIEVSAGTIAFGLDRSWLRGLFSAAPRDDFYRGISGLLLGVLRERPTTLPRIFIRG